jgi:glycosyltransferase involved in cell wall biosynthesis
LVEDGVDGLLVPPGDIAALAAAISQFCGNRAMRQVMGAAGRRKVEAQYRWEEIGERLEETYVDVLGGAAEEIQRTACAS